MTDERYNGWTNYETWNFNLHYDGLWQDEADDIVINVVRKGIEDGDSEAAMKNAARRELADVIEATAWDMLNGASVEGFFADALNHAIQSVNWEEVAEHYTDELVDSAVEHCKVEAEEEEVA